jgi:anti-sigma regulatory factor (Ser/Thr protein kinase)
VEDYLVSELLWMNEDELREACRLLASRVYQTEQRMVMMAMGIQEAVEYGYRVGYEDGITGQSYSATDRDEASLVLH